MCGNSTKNCAGHAGTRCSAASSWSSGPCCSSLRQGVTEPTGQGRIPMAELRLEGREFRDPTRGRWGLTDAAGSFLADHEVRLDPASWEFEAVADLRHYASWHAADPLRAGCLPGP